jgi:hypothetical protein
MVKQTTLLLLGFGTEAMREMGKRFSIDNFRLRAGCFAALNMTEGRRNVLFDLPGD